jgi:hypothetical protein
MIWLNFCIKLFRSMTVNPVHRLYCLLKFGPIVIIFYGRSATQTVRVEYLICVWFLCFCDLTFTG